MTKEQEQSKKELAWLNARLNTSLPDLYELAKMLKKRDELEKKVKAEET